jgi:hypothetical protein
MTRPKFDIIKFCENNKTGYDANVQYVKLTTGGNDPTMSKAMRYAQYIRNTNIKNAKPYIPPTPPIDPNRPYL